MKIEDLILLYYRLRSSVEEEATLDTDFGVQQLRSVVLKLRGPVALLASKLVSLRVDVLNECSSDTMEPGVASDEQIVQVQAVANGPGVSVSQVVGKADQFPRVIHCHHTVHRLLRIEESLEGCFSGLIRDDIECLVELEV